MKGNVDISTFFHREENKRKIWSIVSMFQLTLCFFIFYNNFFNNFHFTLIKKF